MSRHALSLPIRTLPSAKSFNPQWICRRCLATQTEQATTSATPDFLRAQEPPTSDYDPTLPASQRLGPDGKPYRLKKSDFFLKKKLPQTSIPSQHLQHSTSSILHENEKRQRALLMPHKRIVGVVVSAGKMDKTVKVRIATQTWNTRIKKNFSSHENYLVHDPNNSLIEGDVVELHRLRVSSAVSHVVAAVTSPFGKPLSDRPPIPTPDERLAAYKEMRFAKLKRRELRARAAEGDAEAIEELRSMGLDKSDGAQSGKPESGKRRSEKGQKLPAGALPGGEQEAGKGKDRSRRK